MKFFISAEVIKVAATAYKLIKLDVFDKNIRLPVLSVKLEQPPRLFFLQKVYWHQKYQIFDKIT